MNKEVFRVVTFVPQGAKDSRFGLVRPNGLAILNISGEAVGLTVKQYNTFCRRISDKKYCELKEGVSVDALLAIKDKRRKSLVLEVNMEDEVDKTFIHHLCSAYPEFSREEIIDMVSDYT